MTRRILSLLLAAILVFSLAACNKEPDPTQPPATTQPAPTEPPAAEIYQHSRAAVDSATDLTLELETKKTVTVSGEAFKQTTSQKLSMSGLGSDSLQVSMTEDTELNDYVADYSEFYADGTFYSCVMDTSHFTGAITQEAYLARFAPAVLLDASLYESIASSPKGDSTRITFESPSAAESWAMPDGAELISAEGSAMIAADGSLTSTTYSISYAQGGIQVDMTVTATPIVEQSITLTAPTADQTSIEISHIDIPKLYDQATLYLYSTHSASSMILETIVSQAAGAARIVQNRIHFDGAGTDHVSDIDYQVSIIQDTQFDYSSHEHYEDGKYTISEDDGREQTGEVAPMAMLEYCQGFLSDNVIPLDYIASMEAIWWDGLLYLELDCTEEYGEIMNESISELLFNDPEFLNGYASAYTTNSCTGYLAIDTYTGFPTAAGIQYEGCHTIEGEDCLLTLNADQSFTIASPETYAEVTGSLKAEPEPEQKPTPLFYHVTGEEGQEMWLLGTIHVGDSRTAYLPQEIYDALDASDALAVEFDTQSFEDQIEDDDELMAQVAEAYYYSDGTTVADVIDEELYREAVKLLKASGNYSTMADSMKPYLWSQSIDNFFLQLGHTLYSEMGVDNRLLTLAKEKGMEIRDVESGIFQIEMMVNYSPELQELMLESSVTSSPDENIAGTQELFELWCAGDEAALREAICEEVDTSEMTEEELAEYEAAIPLLEEYDKAMSFDRNEDMLQVAIDYLESGDTVFYAVGLAHLLDDTNGLVDTLRQAGYTVELVPYN